MKKRLSVVFLSLLCALSLALVACGGTPEPEGTEDGKSEDTTQTDKKAAPEEKFIGEWKLASFGYENIVVAGDFTELFGSEKGMTLTVAKDGTGALSLDDEDASTFTWTVKDDDSLELTITSGEDEDTVVPLVYDDGALVLSVEEEDMLQTATFTADGTAKNVELISLADASDVTSVDELVGTWKVYGMGMGKAMIYADAEGIDSILGEGENMDLVINKDGSALFGEEEELTISVDKNGATMGNDDGAAPIKIYEDSLLLDMSEMYGDDLFLLYKK